MASLRIASSEAPLLCEERVSSAFLLSTLIEDVPDNGGQEILVHVGRRIRSELQSDDLLIWHNRAGEPRLLFAEGAGTGRSSNAREAAELALLAARLPPAGPVSQWCATEHLSLGGMLITGLPANGGTVVVVNQFKKASRSTRLRASEAMAKLLPLLQPFFALWALRLRLVSRLQGLTEAINSSDVATLLIGWHGQVTFANRAAEALLARNDGLRRTGDFLAGAQPSDTIRLQAAISHVLSTRAEHDSPSPFPIVPIYRSRGRALMVAIIAFGGPDRRASDDAAVLHVIDPDQDLQALLEPTCKFYRLSPVEARLAGLLTSGMTLAEAAVAVRVREQTARSYLKQIFAKTDTNRQAELVRLLLTSSIRVAPRHRLALA